MAEKIIENTAIALTLTAVFGAGFYFLSLQPYGHQPLSEEKLASTYSKYSLLGTDHKISTRSSATTNATPALGAFLRAELIEILRQYSDEIDDLAIQASLVQLRDYVVNLSPAGGYKLFVELVHEVFPKHAASILQAIRNMDHYNQWLLQNTRELASMAELDAEQFLWNKRRELFGEAADRIWSDEIAAYENRKHKIRSTIAELSQSTIISNDEKLYQLKNSLEQVYAYSIDGFLLNKGLVSNVFLEMQSVQQELIALEPEARQQRLDNYRSQMGFSEQAIARMRSRDAKRNGRWDKGHSYMQAKAELENQYSGDQLAVNLSALREEHFQHEAKTIALEEESGFYRYLRPRVYGRN